MVTNKAICRDFSEGWYPLFDALVAELDALPIDICLVQAKEKYALLRVYYTIQDRDDNYRAIIDSILDKYAAMSKHTCLVCGSAEGVNQHYINDYLVTICNKCYEKEVKKETGWFTQADCIEGFDELSESQKAYRLSQKVYLDPALETLREANKKDGISYIVSIAGYKYRFYHTEDAFKFEYVKERAYCSYIYFVGTLASGQVWESGDVKVWMKNKGGK